MFMIYSTCGGSGPHCGDEVDRHLPRPTKKLKKEDGAEDRRGKS